MASPEEIQEIMKFFGVDELGARFIAAVSEGEIDGDIIEVESIEELDRLLPPVDESEELNSSNE